MKYKQKDNITIARTNTKECTCSGGEGSGRVDGDEVRDRQSMGDRESHTERERNIKRYILLVPFKYEFE